MAEPIGGRAGFTPAGAIPGAGAGTQATAGSTEQAAMNLDSQYTPAKGRVDAEKSASDLRGTSRGFAVAGLLALVGAVARRSPLLLGAAAALGLGSMLAGAGEKAVKNVDAIQRNRQRQLDELLK